MSAAVAISKSEQSYIHTALKAAPPLREDGRSLLDFRSVLLATGVAPLANGSARINIGKSPEEGGGGTEVLGATKLEVEDVGGGDGVDGGRITCTVIWYVFHGQVGGLKISLPEFNNANEVLQLRIRTCPRTHWTSCSMITLLRCIKHFHIQRFTPTIWVYSKTRSLGI